MNNEALTPETEQALLRKAQDYCALDEQCGQSVRRKLLTWGADSAATERIIDSLTESGYLDESRYCRLFCSSKLRLQKWGRIKINYMLRSKGIASDIIDEALAEIDEEQYQEVLLQLASAKWRTLHDSDPAKRIYKLNSYLASHGFESGAIRRATQQLIQE